MGNSGVLKVIVLVEINGDCGVIMVVRALKWKYIFIAWL